MTSTIPRTQRKWIYLYLVGRDGAKCSICGNKEKRVKLEIDHIDGNPANQYHLNLRLLCHSCNIKTAISQNKESRHKHHGVCVERGGENLDATTRIKRSVDYQRGSPEMQVNDFAELEFRNYIIARIKRDGEIEKEDAVGSGAEIVGVSVNASRNYLIKMVSKEGPCYEVKLPSKTRVIRLKDRYLKEKEDSNLKEV